MSKVLADFEVAATGKNYVIIGDYEEAAPSTDDAAKSYADWLAMPDDVDDVIVDGKSTTELGEFWSGAKISPEMAYLQALAAYVNDDQNIIFHDICSEAKEWKEKFQSYTHKVGDRNIPNIAATPAGESAVLVALSKDGNAYYAGNTAQVALYPNGSTMTDMENFFIDALVDEKKEHKLTYCTDACRDYINEYMEPDIIYSSDSDDKNLEKEMKSYGLLERKENYLVFSQDDVDTIGKNVEPTSTYKLCPIATAGDLVTELGKYNDSENHDLQILRTDDQPYLEADVANKHYVLIPMQWMEQALKSPTCNEWVSKIMAADQQIEKTIWEQEPETLRGHEALFILRSCVQHKVNIESAENISALATQLGRLHFLKLKEDINNKLEDDKNNKTSIDRTINSVYEIINDALDPKNRKYVLPSSEDKKLTEGIETMLTSANPIEVRNMVEKLFSKERTREISRLRSIEKTNELTF